MRILGMRLLLLLLAATLGACAPEQSGAPEQSANRSISVDLPVSLGDPVKSPPDPPSPPPAPPSLPGLLPLTEAQISAELDSGASCTLSDGGPPLMVAMLGGAVVNDRGRITHLKPEAKDWNALSEGGRFAGGDLIIEVDAGQVVARHEELVERDASVSIKRGNRGFGVSHGPRWACGS